MAVLTWAAAGIETARPFPPFDRVRIADTPRDAADVTSAEIDLPSVRAVRVEVSDSAKRLDRRLFDGRLDTIWMTRGAQRGRERFAIPLAESTRVSGVVMTLGDKIFDYPRMLSIETSRDGEIWEQAWQGPTAALAFRAVIENPKLSRLTFRIPTREAKTIRLRQVGSSRR